MKKSTKNYVVIGIALLVLTLGTAHYAGYLTWFMPSNQIKVTDTTIDYYVSISGNSWKVDLRDSAGNLVNSASGTSYGYHSFPRPPAGTYYLSVWCFYGSSTCTSNNVETVIVPPLYTPTPVPTLNPIVTTPQPVVTTIQPTPIPTVTVVTYPESDITPTPVVVATESTVTTVANIQKIQTITGIELLDKLINAILMYLRSL